MIIFLIILLVIIFNSVQFASPNSFNKDYLSIEKTNAIKGIFVILILFSHYSQYVTLEGIYDEPYLLLQKYLHQMVVVMFLFYSGYGMMESIKRKGYIYIESIIRIRFWKVLINFDIAVLLYLFVGLLCGNKYSISRILLSFIGWSSIGNSNWYIFIILCLYLLVFISFFYLKYTNKESRLYIGGILLLILSLAFVYLMMRIDRPSRYYNTLFIFTVGVWYSLLKEHIEKVLMKNDYIYCFFGVILTALYLVSYECRWEYGIKGYTLWAILFTLLIIFITMKISISNNFLNWFGTHVFSVYILQRLPMIILSQLNIIPNHKYVFFIATFICTIFISMVFDYLTEKLHKIIFYHSK